VLSGWLDVQTFTGSLVTILLAGFLFLIVLLVAGYGLRIKEINDLIFNITAKLKGAKGDR
jgi:hypothetical protein